MATKRKMSSVQPYLRNVQATAVGSTDGKTAVSGANAKTAVCSTTFIAVRLSRRRNIRHLCVELNRNYSCSSSCTLLLGRYGRFRFVKNVIKLRRVLQPHFGGATSLPSHPARNYTTSLDAVNKPVNRASYEHMQTLYTSRTLAL